MIHQDKAQNLYIHLTPGRQVLDGEKALQYVRYRSAGDIALVDPFKGNMTAGWNGSASSLPLWPIKSSAQQ